MKNITKFVVAIMATATLSFVGCNSSNNYDLAQVTGKVTSNGEPVAGIRVNFAPQSVGDNHMVGPWSTAVTDVQGVYTLKTRYKEAGAVVGKHDVSFEYDDMPTMEELMEDLESAREEESAEEVKAVQKQIAELKAMSKTRPQVSEDFSLVIDVPQGGTQDANLELSK